MRCCPAHLPVHHPIHCPVGTGNRHTVRNYTPAIHNPVINAMCGRTHVVFSHVQSARKNASGREWEFAGILNHSPLTSKSALQRRDEDGGRDEGRDEGDRNSILGFTDDCNLLRYFLLLLGKGRVRGRKQNKGREKERREILELVLTTTKKDGSNILTNTIRLQNRSP